VNSAFVLLKVGHWAARGLVLAGVVFLFVAGLGLASMQGFSPDGPSPGFVRVPTLLFAFVAMPYLLFVFLYEAPWISLPLVGFALADLVWLVAVPKARKSVVASRLRSHAAAVLAACVGGAVLYAAMALHAHRPGPAELCVFNDSEFTCEDVLLEGDDFVVRLGTMLPGDRRFAIVQPQGRSDVVLRCLVDDMPHELAFTGGVEDSRKYYYQFAIGRGLRAEYGAWDVRRWKSDIGVLVRNTKPEEIREIVVSGPGFERAIPSLPSGGEQKIRISPKGPLVSVRYFTADGARHVYSSTGWGLLEGPPVLLNIGDPADFGFQ
jgi:hypothetical protein